MVQLVARKSTGKESRIGRNHSIKKNTTNHIKPTQTYHIHITGLVQGIGFRPYVYGVAQQYRLTGWVCNSNDGVHIEFNAEQAIAKAFYTDICNHPPAGALLQYHQMQQVIHIPYTDFRIRTSEQDQPKGLLITPDYATCSHCTMELRDPDNRRYHYPFITCAQCGPRYSILQAMPYDRGNTHMQHYTPCEQCHAEYDNPQDRRYYAQTNSCSHCGIRLQWYNAEKQLLSTDTPFILEVIPKRLKAGAIIAVKGIGGYLLLCDATNTSAVERLRQRKQRPAKPFALLYPTIQHVEEAFSISKAEKEALIHSSAPIVLLRPHPDTITKLASAAIAPGLRSLGVMLPYTPLLQLISARVGLPLVATSGNSSGSPIYYTDADALEYLTAIADDVLANDRPIALPQDDSVIRFSPARQQKIIYRRSRGLAPSHPQYRSVSTDTILATGALLKSSFCCTAAQDTFISQYLGNTDHYEAQQAYKTTLSQVLHLLQQSPDRILADKHPQYFTHQYARQLAGQYRCPVHWIGHHKAHAAAVLAENKLIHHAAPVLCVVWDGTGLGEDGQLWGSEFFVYHNNCMQRCFHFEYFPVLAGDKMATEPRLAALAACSHFGISTDQLQSKFSATEWRIYHQLLQHEPDIQTSSAGRLFDAAAALLGLCDKQRYEGEAALLLEEAATHYFDTNGYDNLPESYFAAHPAAHQTPIAVILLGMQQDMIQEAAIPYMAAKFHVTLAALIQIIAAQRGCRIIACSGGVFQNALLVDLLLRQAGDQYILCCHQELSPNDENIAFGQMVYWDNNIDNCKKLHSATTVQVSDTTMSYSSTIVR
jgi:hydrogenase maturation protein HypF